MLKRTELTVAILPIIFLFSFSSNLYSAENAVTNSLYKACQEKNLALVKKLVSEGADVNGKDSSIAPQNQSFPAPIFAAAENNDLEIIKFLVSRGADINIKSGNSETPLYMVSGHRKGLPAVKFLVEHGADVNIQNPVNSSKYDHFSEATPIFSAVRNEDFETIRYLVSRGAKLNIVADGWGTLLYLACVQGDKEGLIEFLIKSGADVNLKNKTTEKSYFNSSNYSEETPIFAALKKNDFATVRLLLRYGARVKVFSRGSGTPLNIASMGGDPGLVELLIEKGADVNFVADSETFRGAPIHLAAERSSADVVGVLLKHGADISIRYPAGENGYHTGYTALHFAAENDSSDLVKFLVESGADVNAQNDEKETPIIIALREHHTQISEYLDKNGSVYIGTEGHNNLLLSEKKQRRGETVDAVGRFFKYNTLPLAYLGTSAWLYESKFKNNRSDNVLGTANAYALIVPSTTVFCGAIGGWITGGNERDHGGQFYIPNSAIGNFFGGLVGFAGGTAISYGLTSKMHHAKNFKTNRILYYAAPAGVTGVTIFAFTQSF